MHFLSNGVEIADSGMLASVSAGALSSSQHL